MVQALAPPLTGNGQAEFEIGIERRAWPLGAFRKGRTYREWKRCGRSLFSLDGKKGRGPPGRSLWFLDNRPS